jgi:hypothetical protein
MPSSAVLTTSQTLVPPPVMPRNINLRHTTCSCKSLSFIACADPFDTLSESTPNGSHIVLQLCFKTGVTCRIERTATNLLSFLTTKMTTTSGHAAGIVSCTVSFVTPTPHRLWPNFNVGNIYKSSTFQVRIFENS